MTLSGAAPPFSGGREDRSVVHCVEERCIAFACRGVGDTASSVGAGGTLTVDEDEGGGFREASLGGALFRDLIRVLFCSLKRSLGYFFVP